MHIKFIYISLGSLFKKNIMKEKLEKLKELIQEIEVDQIKMDTKYNFQASLRIRKNLQEIKKIVPEYRQLVLDERRKNDGGY